MATSQTRAEAPTAGVHRGLVRWYYGALSVLLLATLIAQCALTVSQGRSLVNTFSYFTVQSNVLVLITSAILAIDPSVHGAWWRVLRTAALAGITVTGVVFATVLARTSTVTGIGVLYSVVFHYIVPTATIVGFVFIGPRLQLRMADLAFMVWPILWIVYTLIRGALVGPEFTSFSHGTSHYPYGFLDVDNSPLPIVVMSVVAVALALLGVGLAFIKGDQALTRRDSQQHPITPGH